MIFTLGKSVHLGHLLAVSVLGDGGERRPCQPVAGERGVVARRGLPLAGASRRVGKHLAAGRGAVSCHHNNYYTSGILT